MRLMVAGAVDGAANRWAPRANLKDCTSGQLKFTMGGSDGAAGMTYRTLVFTNQSDQPCQLEGAPLVEATTDNSQVRTRATVEGSASPLVVQPGEKVQSTLRISAARNYDDCKVAQGTSLMIWLDGPSNGPGATPPTSRCASSSAPTGRSWRSRPTSGRDRGHRRRARMGESHGSEGAITPEPPEERRPHGRSLDPAAA